MTETPVFTRVCALSDLPAEGASFFQDGIVFAALDVYNDPVKNPTISGLPPIQ